MYSLLFDLCKAFEMVMSSNKSDCFSFSGKTYFPSVTIKYECQDLMIELMYSVCNSFQYKMSEWGYGGENGKDLL